MAKREDLTGNIYGCWKVLGPAEDYKWECECQCPLHTRRAVLASSLKRGISQSCGNRKYHPKSEVNAREKKTPEELKVKHWSEEAKQNRANKVNTYAIGNCFGDWEIIEKIDVRHYKCKCKKCSTLKTLTTSGLWNARKNNFQCNHNILTGQFFGKLEVLEEKGYDTCICKCHNCNKIVEVLRSNLMLGHYISCGCVRNESKYSKEEIEAAIVNYKITHNNDKPQPFEIAKMLNLGMTSTYKSIYKYDIKDQFDVNSSRAEKDIALLFEDIPNVKRQDRSIIEHYELDIYLPDYRLAIEYNGNYWHSELKKKDAKYHQAKTLAALDKNIRLIHIFEYEWIKKKDLITRYLLSLVNKKEVFHARKLNIQEVSISKVNEFYEKNHLQGKAYSSKVNIVLTNENNEIISAISLGTPRFDKQHQWEIIRYCVKIGTAISGGIERLYKYFENKYNPTSVVTYADASKFTGEVYKKIGFEFKEITTPNYIWANSSYECLPRYKTQKHKLIEMGLGTPDQTEIEIMTGLGYYRVFDCGSFKFVKNNN